MSEQLPADPGPDPAKARFIVLQLVRLSGVAMTLFGLLIATKRVDLPVVAGYFLLAVGLFDAFIMPQILVRRWRSPGG